jgi:hypothetical protein
MAFVLASGGMGAALYMGNCTGHGTGVGGSFQPGHGGGMVRPVATNSATAIWPPTPQLPLGVAGAVAARVVINKLVPIVDQDILIPHPTPTIYTTSSVGDKCAITLPTPAYWCTIGPVGGREAPIGHPRKLMATSLTVFVGKRRLGRFADPLGDGTPAFPCLSLVSGSSPNVFVGI